MSSPSSPCQAILSPSEQKELDKFTKYLALKYVQVIVQSRLGEKIRTASKPDTSSGTSWFNLAIKDNVEVMAESKKSLGGIIPAPAMPLCVEISLKTAEGDSLVLELWRLSVAAGGDPQVKVTHTVYNRMGLLLKSLITVSRVTPAYRLSRRQGADSYVICYRILLGEPQEPADLGEGALTARVGQVTTPVNTVVCSVDYRTRMTITQRPARLSQPILVKSDHFDSSNVTPRLPRRDPTGRVSDDSEQGGVTSDESQEIRIFATSPPDNYKTILGPQAAKEQEDAGKHLRAGAFVIGGGAFVAGGAEDNLPSLEDELAADPLLQLLPAVRPPSTVSLTSTEDTETQFLMSSDSGGKGVATTTASRGRGRKSLADMLRNEQKSPVSRRSSGGSLFGTTEIDKDFVMVDLKTPFAPPPSSSEILGSSGSDPTLGTFFKEVSGAPALTSLDGTSPLVDHISDYKDKISLFEADLVGYDDLLNTMGSGSELEDEK